MPKRTFKLVRVTFPLSGICESCNKSFMSRNEDLGKALKEIHAAFDVHKCERDDASQAAARIVPAEEFSAPLITHDTLFQQFSKYVLTMQLKLNILTVVERWKSRQWMISMRSLA